ncbi:hypothetical protein [Tepidicaulis sp.]|uniref:hypothetical protein n=1 Tax=Tepidicaulis sp. TaxID=1920809 RepID=UPI003B5A0C77
MLRINARAVWRLLFTGTAVLAGLALVREAALGAIGYDTALKDLRHLNLDSEMNFGAWYSSLMMMASAGLLFLTARQAARQAESQGRGHTRSWLALAAAFAYLSLDEATGIHEVFIEPLRSAFGLSGIFYWAWVLPALVLVGGFGLAMVPFLLSLPRRSAALFIASGTLFVGGALGLEMASGYVITAQGEEAPLVALLAICEETLEMLGLALFTGALCDHLARQGSNGSEGAPVLAFAQPAAGAARSRQNPAAQAS